MDEKDKDNLDSNSDQSGRTSEDDGNGNNEENNSRIFNQGLVGNNPTLAINPGHPLWQLQQAVDKQKQLGSGNGNASGSGLSNAEKYIMAGDVIAKTDELKTATQSLQVNELERIYYDRKVKPIVDLVWELSTAAQNFAGMSNLYQANNYGQKRHVKKALDFSLDILDEAEELWDLAKTRVDFFKDNIDPYE
ncbi:hypothetical protein [Clostridium manihotivorum]|uniref:Uncharacterized protein n=1 Tax=Clostridium manihotivorum TaxID=2320868 RepID=A0A3R5QT53_9CLOT|nr:hypothetical protein [Clostridium manihotivorum]QAA31889.1 hypothetical protein C1I91_09645 [Clostridium manihotivorum]